MKFLVITLIVLSGFLGGCTATKNSAKEVAIAATDRLADRVDNTVNKVSDKTLDYIKSLKIDELSNKIGSNLESSNRTIEEVGKLSESIRANSDELHKILVKINSYVDEIEKVKKEDVAPPWWAMLAGVLVIALAIWLGIKLALR